MPDTELVHLSCADGVATITLDSPANRNALSAPLRAQLRAHLSSTATDDAVRVVVLAHTGPVFCAGMDLTEARAGGANTPGISELPAILDSIWRHPKPVIAKLAGPARAGGVGLVAACDLAVAADSVTFAFTEVRIGVVPAVISVTVLARISTRAAQELFLTGETFTAQRAAQIGLLTAAVDPAALDQQVQRYVTALTQGAPAALARTKQLVADQAGDATPARYADMLAVSAAFFASPDAQEGMAAFAEKRQARWVPVRPA
jgi:methylglutaconyl-CoA hydratase